MKTACLPLAILSALVWTSAARVRADTAAPQKSTKPAVQTTHRTTQRAAPKPLTGSQKSSSHRAAKRHVSSRAAKVAAARRRRAMLRPEPERIQEIQQALVKTGYLSSEPNGRWDDATRDAMRRFQTDRGFPATGLPEAKSLMKLGLGPHPLPSEFDAVSGGAASTTPVSTTPTTTTPPGPATPTTPPETQPNPPTTTPQP